MFQVKPVVWCFLMKACSSERTWIHALTHSTCVLSLSFQIEKLKLYFIIIISSSRMYLLVFELFQHSVGVELTGVVHLLDVRAGRRSLKNANEKSIQIKWPTPIQIPLLHCQTSKFILQYYIIIQTQYNITVSMPFNIK